jgi:hypothetical protein
MLLNNEKEGVRNKKEKRKKIEREKKKRGKRQTDK